MHLATLLREARLSADLTLAEVAHAIGRRSPSSTRDIETGRYVPPVQEWARLMVFVGADADAALQAAIADSLPYAAALPALMEAECESASSVEGAATAAR